VKMRLLLVVAISASIHAYPSGFGLDNMGGGFGLDNMGGGFDPMSTLYNTQYAGGFPGYNPFGYGYGYGYGFPNPYGQQPQQQAQPPAARKNFMWLCLEDIFPQSVSVQSGVPPQAAAALSSYATHAYVLHGPTVQESTAWQFSLDAGQDFWMRVLGEARRMDMNNLVSWGETIASRVEGSAKVASSPGKPVWLQSKKCYRSKEEITCSSAQLQQFTAQYKAEHSKFNLLSNNCAMYACSALKYCENQNSGCDSAACSHQLMYNPMEQKDPQCATQEEAHGAQPAAAAQPFDYNVWPQFIEFMPMHDPEIMAKMKAANL